MPHFSPIYWLLTGFIFYVVLLSFVSLFWWMQSYSFLPKLNLGSESFDCSWNWS